MELKSKLIGQTLSRSLDEKALVGLYSRESDPEKFTVGCVLALSSEIYIVATVDDLGRTDEFQAGYLDNLFLVVSGGDYLDAVSGMMVEHLAQWPGALLADDMEEVLSLARDRKVFVSLMHRNEISYHGYIVELDDTTLGVQVYSSTGVDEGYHVVRREDIHRVAYGGPEQRAIASLVASREGMS